MSGFSIEDALKLEVRNSLVKLLPIKTIEDMRLLCNNVEKEVLSLCTNLTQRNATTLFKSVSTNNISDYIVDSNGAFYFIKFVEDFLEKGKIIIVISVVANEKVPMIEVNADLNSTGKYNKISIVVPKRLFRTSIILVDFYKCIFETTYCWFKEQILLYVSDIKNCVARKLYDFLRSIIQTKDLLENFWFAIVGQGYGFRLLDYNLTLNSFELISKNTDTYGSYTNRLVTELLSTRLPSEKMLMQIAIDNKATLVGELRKAVYTAEGSIYSTTLYSLYGGESFVMWPLYIDEFSIVALYPLDVKNEIEKLVKMNLITMRQIIKNEMSQLMLAYNLFSNKNSSHDLTMPKIIRCIHKILSALNEASVLISRDVGVNIYDIFKSHFDYDEEVFNSAMKILKDNYYIVQDSMGNYHITDSGILCLSKGGIQMKQDDKMQTFNFYGGTYNSSFIGSSVKGNVNNGVDMVQLNNIISKIFETIKSENQFNQNIVISEIEKIRAEVTCQKPNKDTIKSALDWIQTITSIAGLGLSLGQVLSPLL